MQILQFAFIGCQGQPFEEGSGLCGKTKHNVETCSRSVGAQPTGPRVRQARRTERDKVPGVRMEGSAPDLQAVEHGGWKRATSMEVDALTKRKGNKTGKGQEKSRGKGREKGKNDKDNTWEKSTRQVKHEVFLLQGEGSRPRRLPEGHDLAGSWTRAMRGRHRGGRLLALDQHQSNPVSREKGELCELIMTAEHLFQFFMTIEKNGDVQNMVTKPHSNPKPAARGAQMHKKAGKP